MSLLMPQDEALGKIYSALNGRIIPVVPAVDPTMWCPSKDWLENEFADFLAANLPPYKLHTHDCDDFSDRARFLMTECMRNTPEAQGHGHSMGVFRVWISAGKSLLGVPGGAEGLMHENNVVVTNTGEPFLFEPQNVRDHRDKLMVGLNVAVTRLGALPVYIPRI